MRFARYRSLAIPLLFAALPAALLAGAADAPNAAKTTASSLSQPTTAALPSSAAQNFEVYPQIVRISLLEGDVRVSRGTKNAPWEAAAVNLPLDEGFNLVTGAGRAEIEFEDASTAYLGENSVLTFNTLTSTNGVPRTDVTLVSGTLTLDEKPRFSGQRFTVHSPTENFAVVYPSHVLVRIDSYLDAMTITPQRDLVLKLPVVGAAPIEGAEPASQPALLAQKLVKGSSITIRSGHVAPMSNAEQAAMEASHSTQAAWDTWVAQRVSERDAAITVAMREAGLNTPIPGLAELRAQGHFFSCAPYGTCWEPNGGWASKYVVNVNQLKTQGAAVQQAVSQMQLTNQSGPGGYIGNGFFPCTPGQLNRFAWRDPATGQQLLVSRPYDLAGSWAACHAGAWIPNNGGYSWVVLQKKHHHCPITWVKYQGKTGFVPVHPNDIAGKRPINLEHGVFTPSGRKDAEIQLVAFNPAHSVKLREEAPERFSSPSSAILARAETPKLEAHPLLGSSTQALANRPATAGVPISFNRNSQSLQLALPITQGNHTTTTVQRFGGSSSFAQSGAGSSSASHSFASSSFSGSASHSASSSASISSSASSSASSAAHK